MLSVWKTTVRPKLPITAVPTWTTNDRLCDGSVPARATGFASTIPFWRPTSGAMRTVMSVRRGAVATPDPGNARVPVRWRRLLAGGIVAGLCLTGAINAAAGSDGAAPHPSDSRGQAKLDDGLVIHLVRGSGRPLNRLRRLLRRRSRGPDDVHQGGLPQSRLQPAVRLPPGRVRWSRGTGRPLPVTLAQTSAAPASRLRRPAPSLPGLRQACTDSERLNRHRRLWFSRLFSCLAYSSPPPPSSGSGPSWLSR